MPRLVPAAVLALLGLAAAAASCAQSSAIQQGTGGNAPTLGGTSGTGVRGCGVQSSAMSCQACINATCCAEGQACAAEATCLACLDQGSDAAACQNDRPFGTLMQCLRDNCSERCFGSSGGAGGAGGAGGRDPTTTSATTAGGDTSSSTAVTTSSAATTAASTTAATTSASTTSGAGGSTSSSTAATTTTSTSSGGGPLSCAGVDGDIGCCDGSGVLHWCSDGQTVVDQPCTGGDVCGWNPSWAFYDCVPPPAQSDPTSTYPMTCGG